MPAASEFFKALEFLINAQVNLEKICVTSNGTISALPVIWPKVRGGFPIFEMYYTRDLCINI